MAGLTKKGKLKEEYQDGLTQLFLDTPLLIQAHAQIKMKQKLHNQLSNQRKQFRLHTGENQHSDGWS